MSVPQQNPVTLATGNGVTTVFAYQFLLSLTGDLVVTVAGVVKTLNVDYTVTGLGNPAGGSVTLTAAPANLASIILQRVIALKRDTDYQYEGDFKTTTVNSDFDRPWQALQGLDEEVKRSIRVAANSPAVTLELPAPVALTYLRWNALANRLENTLLADISLISLTPYAQTLLNAISASAARTVLGATSVGAAIFTAADAAAQRIAMGIEPARSHLAGLTMSTAGSSATMSIAAGQATDSTNAVVFTLAATSKTTSAWALGAAAGGLDTGAIANSTWYHFYTIRRPDTGVTDVVFSTNATTPTLPTNYTQFRRIGSGRTNGSAQWVRFSQSGDKFLWDVTSADLVNFTGSTAIQNLTLLVPLGVRVSALISPGGIAGAAGDSRAWIFSPDVNSAAALAGVTNYNVGGANVAQVWGDLQVRTNTASQISYAISNANTALNINTRGWVDRRGRDA